jgi:hypothetical protein
MIGVVAVGTTGGLLAASAWSFASGRRSGGARDHRRAVDRLILVITAVVAANGLLGSALLITGSRPADPLHLLYGPIALVTPALGWWLGGRGARPPGQPDRSRRDAWLLVASIVLLGVEARLFATG